MRFIAKMCVKLCVIAVVLFGCAVIGKMTHPRGVQEPQAAAEQPAGDEQPAEGTVPDGGGEQPAEGTVPDGGGEQPAELKPAAFFGAEMTADNPWGVTAGMISAEETGECALLTPGTSAVYAASGADGRKIQYCIFPGVCAVSDGAVMQVTYLRADGSEIANELIDVDSSGVWADKQLDLTEYADAVTFRITCYSGSGTADCDWLLLR